MPDIRPLLFTLVLVVAATVAGGSQTPPQAPPQPPRQPADITVIIGEEIGAPPRYAVPDFIALSGDAETVAAAKTIGEVLFADLAFEREFYMIPRDTYRTIPAASSFIDVPFDRWRELGADGVVIGTVQEAGDRLQVQVRLFNARTGHSVFGREYTGSAANPRSYAHTIADEIHLQQRGLRGVARTKIAFSSDRDGERVVGPLDERTIQEVYIADYDGANQRRVTTSRSLSITPVWSHDARALAFTSYRRGYQDIFISFLYEGRMENPTRGNPNNQNYLPAWAPDGSRIAFTSNRDGNPEIYVMNADGSGVRRLTNHPAIDVTPTWSPTGTHVAFVSDRTGTPQIYMVGVDGTGLRRITFGSHSDRPTWSPTPFNEIAYTARTGPGYDIKIYDLASGETRQITFGEGSNESPSFSPNGRHVAFTTTRWGRQHIATIGRDGRGIRQITRAGNNRFPNWSQ
jgi:TolB protein